MFHLTVQKTVPLTLELTPFFIAMATIAVIFAGISKGGFGSGAAFAATPFLALVIDPSLAVGFLLPLLMVMDLASLRAFWGKWSWRDAKALMIGGTFGVLTGGAFFSIMDENLLRILIGLIAVGFVFFQLARSQGIINVPPRRFQAKFAGLWGGVAGFTSFISHAGGPPAAVHLLSQNLNKTTYQATTVITFWWINVVKLPIFFATGLITRDMLGVNFLFIPVALIGVALGVYAHRLVNEVLFFRITYVLLTITGSKLILDGLT